MYIAKFRKSLFLINKPVEVPSVVNLTEYYQDKVYIHNPFKQTLTKQIKNSTTHTKLTFYSLIILLIKENCLYVTFKWSSDSSTATLYLKQIQYSSNYFYTVNEYLKQNVEYTYKINLPSNIHLHINDKILFSYTFKQSNLQTSEINDTYEALINGYSEYVQIQLFYNSTLQNKSHTVLSRGEVYKFIPTQYDTVLSETTINVKYVYSEPNINVGLIPFYTSEKQDNVNVLIPQVIDISTMNFASLVSTTA